jgi:hypothetical protein
LAASATPSRPETSPELGENGAFSGPLAPATTGAASDSNLETINIAF